MDQRTRKLMTMHKALHSRDDVDRWYMSRKERGRGLASIDDRVYASIQRLEDYIEKRGGRLIKATRNNTDNTRTNGTEIARKQKWEEKQIYGGFKRHITRENVDVAKKGKPSERNWICSNSSTKQCHKDKLYQSKNRWDNEMTNVGHLVIETKWSIPL